MLKNAQKDFIKRHIGPSETEQENMLKELGFKNLDDLISKTVPEKILLKEDLSIGDSNSEYKALVIVSPFLDLAASTIHLWAKATLLLGRISTGTWYVAPPTLRGLTSKVGIVFFIASSNNSNPGLLV